MANCAFQHIATTNCHACSLLPLDLLVALGREPGVVECLLLLLLLQVIGAQLLMLQLSHAWELGRQAPRHEWQ